MRRTFHGTLLTSAMIISSLHHTMFVSSTNVLKTCTTAFSPSPWCFRPRYSERTRSCTLRRQSLRMSSGNATNSAPMEPSAELDIAARIAATAAKIAAEEAEIYNRNIGQSFRRYDPFHRAVLEKIGERMGPVDLKEIEELELDAPVNLPQIDEEPTVPLSQGRGGRFSSDRKKIQKKYYEPSLDAKKTRRHFRYKVRGGDLFVKVILTGKDFEKTYRPSDANGFDFLRNGGSANNNFMDSLMNEGTEPGGLVLEIPKELQSIITGTSNTGAGKKRPYPFDYYEGEQESLRAIRDFKSLPVPAPIVAGDLWDDDYIRNMRSAKKNVTDLVSGGYGVLEWVEMKRSITPYLVGRVAEQMAALHLNSLEKMKNHGLHIDTFLGQRRLRNGEKKDFLEFFVENRLEPEFCDASGPKEKVDRSAEYSDKIRQKIGFFGNKILERLIDSHVWREIFAPVLEQSPSMLHGDIWLGNIAEKSDKSEFVFGPASWWGPAEYDLSVGETFGMPQRFFEGYHHYNPQLEGYEMRMKVYKLYHLLNHLNQPSDYKYNFNIAREPLFEYRPDNFLGGRTLTNFNSQSVLNPGKHQYRSEMEMITRGGWFDPDFYLREVMNLIYEIRDVHPPQQGGQIFKFWGKAKKPSRGF
uniref:protein-ribulosamine 3-kinase n=1 Tax=Hanusia phi TaxID=3032 RepID=A0A7S0EH96_9CRYP